MQINIENVFIEHVKIVSNIKTLTLNIPEK